MEEIQYTFMLAFLSRNGVHIMGFLLVSIIVLTTLFVIWRAVSVARTPIAETTPEAGLRYVALGDSYTIGQGIPSDESFPSQLVRVFAEESIPVTLVANPSRTGFTTQNLIDQELPIFERAKPDAVTILIGVNDWVQGVSEERFRTNVAHIFDAVLETLPRERVLVISIPDFSVMPIGKTFSLGRDISSGLARFNTIIQEEAEKRTLKTVDIFPLSQTLSESRFIAPDGLHPSKEAYALWVQEMLPSARIVFGQ